MISLGKNNFFKFAVCFIGTFGVEIFAINMVVFICQRHYKVKFEIDSGYVFQTAVTFSLS